MARIERLVNNAADTLNGAINSSVTSLQVNSASGFPTEGDFRIIIDSEILLVTAVSGTTFTVERGADSSVAASHSNNADVTAIVTAGSLTRFARDKDPWFNLRPPYRIVDNNGDFLDASDFTQVTFTSNAAAADSDGNITLTQDDHAGVELSMLMRTAPSTPYTITGAFTYQMLADAGTTGPLCGLAFRETSSSNVIFHSIQPGATGPNGFKILYHANSTASSSTLLQKEPALFNTLVWQKLEDDGTNIKFHLSHDGVNFVEIYSELRGANFTTGPDQVGLCINNVNGVDDNYISLIAWDGE